MKQLDKWSTLGCTALGLMCCIWLCSGWYILLTGGYYSTPRHAKVSTYVDGASALIMALVLLSLAAVSSCVIRHSNNSVRRLG